jgi:hypothetical protein
MAKKKTEVQLLTPVHDPNQRVMRIKYSDAAGLVYEIPTLIEAEITAEHYSAIIRFRIEPGDPQNPQLDDLHVTGRGIPLDVLRALKLGNAKRDILDAATTTWQQVEGQPAGVLELKRAGGVPDVVGSMLRRGRRPEPERIEAETKQVAAEYRRALRNKERAPVQAVADKLNMNRRTVQRRMDRAVERGLIKGGK